MLRKPRQSTKTANLPMANRMPPLAPRALRTANRPRRRRGQRSLDATQWNRGSTLGILCARSCPSRQDSERRKPKRRSERCRKAWVATQAAGHTQLNPTTIPFFQSLPQSGPDFSTMTHRLRSLRESPTPSWAGIGAPRFHCVASRLRIALTMPRRAPLLV